MSGKKGLGRGLGALLSNPVSYDEDSKEYIRDIKIEDIVANADQPRKIFLDENLEDLKASIERFGVIQPIIVRKKDTKYEIIAGERRYRASKLLGKETIPSIVKDMDDIEVKKVALIENIQREDLSVVEEAMAYRYLIDELKITQDQLSEEIGKSRSHISNTLRLLNLDEKTLRAIEEGIITRGHGRAVLPLEEGVRLQIINETIEKEFSVRDLESRVKEIQKSEKRDRSEKKDNMYLKELEEDLISVLATKVQLNLKKKKGGKIEIEFYDIDDLNRLIELIKQD